MQSILQHPLLSFVFASRRQCSGLYRRRIIRKGDYISA